VVHGLQEARVNWDVASRLKRELEAAGIEVTLTRRAAGEYVDSAERARRAQRAGAALMLRLHADAGAGRGFTVYYPRQPGRVLGRVGPSLAVRQASERAGRAFYPALAAALAGQLPGNGLRGDDRSRPGGKRGALAGSVFSEVPVLLVEMAFLTNPVDAAWLGRPRNRQRMAAALARGVMAVRSAARAFDLDRRAAIP
jgi:N-acetylmuramoyl-L-alanine amidase